MTYVRRLGVRHGLRSLFKVLTAKESDIRISIPSLKAPITLRADTSDIPTFEQIFIWRDYDVPLQVAPKFIIDGGANVGYASIFFANRYPDARIVAVEPEASNVELLRQNTSPYPNISIIQAGIWHKRASLEIENPKDPKWMFRVRETQPKEGSFESVTIPDILEQSHAGQVDILKLDIEGAEKELFSVNPAWLGEVNVLIIELHDQYKPGCSESFYSAVSKYGFTEFRRGENVFLVKSEAATARQ